jgi:hypothetical protein
MDAPTPYIYIIIFSYLELDTSIIVTKCLGHRIESIQKNLKKGNHYFYIIFKKQNKVFPHTMHNSSQLIDI